MCVCCLLTLWQVDIFVLRKKKTRNEYKFIWWTGRGDGDDGEQEEEEEEYVEEDVGNNIVLS